MESDTKHKSEVIFRGLLVLCLFETVFSFGRMIVGKEWPKKAVEYNEWFTSQDIGYIEILGFACAGLGELIAIISVIGMFYYYSKARYSFIAAIILFLLSALVIKAPVLIDNIDSVSTGLSSISSGIVLAMSFLQPVREKFERNS